MREVKSKYYHYFLDDNENIQGVYKRWHENGSPAVIANYESGLLHGAWCSWYSNGSQEIIATYEFDAEVGEYIEYFSTGQLSYHRVGSGETISLFTSGKISYHVYEVDGEPIFDFQKDPYPSSEEEKILIMLKYGGKFLPAK